MLNDWSEPIPRPLAPESVTDMGFQAWKSWAKNGGNWLSLAIFKGSSSHWIQFRCPSSAVVNPWFCDFWLIEKVYLTHRMLAFNMMFMTLEWKCHCFVVPCRNLSDPVSMNLSVAINRGLAVKNSNQAGRSSARHQHVNVQGQAKWPIHQQEHQTW